MNSSLTSGNEAVEAIIDYAESVAMIQEALNLTGIANQTVNVTLGNINNLMTEGLAATATILLNTSMEILGDAERLYGVVRGLLQRVNETREAYERAQNQTQQISDLVIMLDHDVNELIQAISMNHDRLNNILNTIQQRLDTVYMIYAYVISVVPTLEQNVTSSQSQLDRIKMVMHINFIMYAINYYFIIMQTYLDVDSILESTSMTAADAYEAFTNRTLLLDNVTILSTSNQGQLEALNSSIDSLQQQLQRALQAAASVSFRTVTGRAVSQQYDWE